jgi:hypothetical protein
VSSSRIISGLCFHLALLVCRETRSHPRRKPRYEWMSGSHYYCCPAYDNPNLYGQQASVSRENPIRFTFHGRELEKISMMASKSPKKWKHPQTHRIFSFKFY